MRRKTWFCNQRRLGVVFIWRWLLSAMWIEDYRAIFVKAKLNFLFFCDETIFPVHDIPLCFCSALDMVFALLLAV